MVVGWRLTLAPGRRSLPPLPPHPHPPRPPPHLRAHAFSTGLLGALTRAACSPTTLAPKGQATIKSKSSWVSHVPARWGGGGGGVRLGVGSAGGPGAGRARSVPRMCTHLHATCMRLAVGAGLTPSHASKAGHGVRVPIDAHHRKAARLQRRGADARAVGGGASVAGLHARARQRRGRRGRAGVGGAPRDAGAPQCTHACKCTPPPHPRSLVAAPTAPRPRCSPWSHQSTRGEACAAMQVFGASTCVCGRGGGGGAGDGPKGRAACAQVNKRASPPRLPSHTCTHTQPRTQGPPPLTRR